MEIHLGRDNSNHLIRVLRTQVDTPITLFNGDGFDYQCRTLDDNGKKTQLLVESKIRLNTESHLNVTLIQGLSRHDRMEATIQKTVELGVNKIIPVICQRSNIKSSKDKIQKKLDHWRKIAISACEQSHRNHVPDITDIVLLKDLTQCLDRDTIKIVLNPTAKKSLKDIKHKYHELPNDAMSVFIGPEGGLNNDEIELLENIAFTSITFGPRTLRTETAGPAVISALQILWGDY
jgi:16S rRNA (uracil1498-N3)-methyltransferase